MVGGTDIRQGVIDLKRYIENEQRAQDAPGGRRQEVFVEFPIPEPRLSATRLAVRVKITETWSQCSSGDGFTSRKEGTVGAE